MNRDNAEILALRALSWAAAVPGALPRFVAQSGLELDDLRRQADNPELLAALLDFLMSDDSLVRAFCEEEGLESRQLHLARNHLPGGEGT
jgi:hypothetical protein